MNHAPSLAARAAIALSARRAHAPSFIPGALALLVTLLALLATPSRAAITDGLVSYWPMDEDLLDKVETSHGTAKPDGTTIVHAPGKFGNGIDLDGVDQYVETPLADEEKFDFPDGNGFTVSTWFRVDAFTKGWQALIAKGEGNRWRIHRNGETDMLVGNGGAADVPVGTTNVNDGEFHHIVLVSDPVGGEVTLYVDGEVEGTNGPPNLENNAMPMMIGENPDSPGRTWDGIIDDVAAWNRPLTPAEVATIYNGGTGRSIAEIIKPPPVFFDFNTPDQAALLELTGSALVEPEDGSSSAPGVPADPGDGYLVVTNAANGERGAVIFPDSTGGQAISGFTFKADLRIGGGTDSPADGFSLNLVRPNDPLLKDPRGEGYAASPTNEANLPEEGSTTGLGVGFDEWFSGGADVIGLSVRLDNVLIEQIEIPTPNGDLDDITSLQTGNNFNGIDDLGWAPFEVVLADSKLTIKYKGEVFLNEKAIDFPPSSGQLVFGGRTGGSNANHHVDNIFLEVIPANLAVVSGFKFGRDFLEFTFTETLQSKVDTDSISLTVDGLPNQPITITNDGEVVVTHVPAAPWDFGSTHSYELIAMDDNAQDIGREGDFTVASPFLPFEEPLPGPDGINGEWGQRFIYNTGLTIDTAQIALDLIFDAANDPAFAGDIHDSTTQVVNVSGIDQDTLVLFGPNDRYPDDIELDLVDDFVHLCRAYLKINEPGDYTIGVHSDDGFACRVMGWNFDTVGGIGTIDPVSPDTFLFATPTGDSNTRAIARDVQPGVYLIEFFWFERGGGDHAEVYAAKGAFTEDLDTFDWQLIGATGAVEEFVLPGVNSDGWMVKTSEPSEGDLGLPLGTIADGLDALADTGTDSGPYDVVNFNDPQSGGPGSIPGDVPFPRNTPADDNDYALEATATLVIPIDATYHFGFQGDDGGWLQIADQDGFEVFSTATGDSIVDDLFGSGTLDTLLCDCLTGNSRTVGEITLTAGNYQIRAGFFERGGGSYTEVFAAQAGSPQLPLLAKDGAGQTIVVQPGLELVGPPGSGLRFTSIVYSKAPDKVTLMWNARKNKTYRILRAATLEIDTAVELSDGESGPTFVDNAPPVGESFYWAVEEE